MAKALLKPQWFQILLAVADSDRHGLWIMKEVLKQTDGKMKLWPATLYGSIKKMCAEGLLEARDGPELTGFENDNRRFYGITPKGRRRLAAEANRLAGYVELARRKAVFENLQ